MNEHDQSFEGLTRLLKLKQHEIPPPGYFNGFSAQVLSSIRQNSSKSQTQSAPGIALPQWLAQVLSIFDTRPGLVGGLATSMVLFLVLGVVLADHSDNESAGVYSSDMPAQPSASLASAAMPGDMPAAESISQGGITVSTNPVNSLQPVSSIFGQDNSLFQMASYSPVGAAGH